MKKTTIALFALTIAAASQISGCTDAEMASWGALGSKSTVTCWSGGQKIFEDESTGKVSQGQSGIYYKSSVTGELVHTYADCIVKQEPER